MINYKTIGYGKSLVLIHGFGFCGEIFIPLIEKYKNNYKITIIDLPGHGKSKNNKNLDDWIEQIQKIIPQNSIILGWSLGGLVAIKLANIMQTKKIILCASSPKFIKNNCWNYGISLNNFQTFVKNINLNTTKGLIRFISLQGLTKLQIRELKQIIINNSPSIIGLNNAFSILLTTDLRNEIKQLKNIEVYLGEKDTIVPKNLINWYQKNKIKVNILSGGHMPFLNDKFLI